MDMAHCFKPISCKFLLPLLLLHFLLVLHDYCWFNGELPNNCTKSSLCIHFWTWTELTGAKVLAHFSPYLHILGYLEWVSMHIQYQLAKANKKIHNHFALMEPEQLECVLILYIKTIRYYSGRSPWNRLYSLRRCRCCCVLYILLSVV